MSNEAERTDPRVYFIAEIIRRHDPVPGRAEEWPEMAAYEILQAVTLNPILQAYPMTTTTP